MEIQGVSIGLGKGKKEKKKEKKVCAFGSYTRTAQ
jgi:hypothetical protein